MGVSILLASAVSGCVSHIFVHPLDTIRSRLMVSTSSSTTCVNVAKDLLRSDGLRGLYRGFGVSLVMQAPAVATFLTTYDLTKSRILETTSLPGTSPIVHLVSGLAAETISSFFWVPMEVVKQRAQVRRGAINASTSTTVVRDLLTHEGPRALFKGFGLTIATYGPYSMLYFTIYERMKIYAKQWTNGNETKDKLPLTFIAGSAVPASAIAAICTTPLDVIKTRLQTQGDASFKVDPKYSRFRPYQGTLHAIRSLGVQEGVNGFFRGVSARVLWIVPSTAITMVVFEYLKSQFDLSV